MSDEKKITIKTEIIDAYDHAQDASANIKVGREERQLLNKTFPPNSHKAKEERKDPKKAGKIIAGKAVIKKKSLAKRFFETFVGEDVNNVKSYIVHDVLIPAARDTISDMFHGSIEMIFGGGSRRSHRNSRDRNKSYVSYDRMSSNKRDDRRDVSSRNRATHNFDDIVLDSKIEAEAVLDHLVDLLMEYKEATVYDLYEAVGVEANYTDKKYGWVDLSSASTSRARGGGYLLNLPKPIFLD